MGSVIHLNRHRQLTRLTSTVRPPQAAGGTSVTCFHCGERHPIVRLPGGEERCVTAFFDGLNWFCRNCGCRRAWLERRLQT